jgi:hypothetical protein
LAIGATGAVTAAGAIAALAFAAGIAVCANALAAQNKPRAIASVRKLDVIFSSFLWVAVGFKNQKPCSYNACQISAFTALV